MTRLVLLLILCFHTVFADDCSISYIDGDLIIKQMNDPSPDEQFLLVLDALGCHIAETASVPINQVTIIPKDVAFPGKKWVEFPATLHTRARGVSIDQECAYQDLDVHQRYRRPNNCFWNQWGPLSPEKTGLTRTVIQNMAKHPDLPMIVALDTFVGNADRSPPNLFYDVVSDRFCGIDMAASFSSPLALAACGQLKNNTSWVDEQRWALLEYGRTLQHLIESWPPEKQKSQLLEYSKMAGFIEGSTLYNQDVAERIEFHKRCIEENYQNSIELLSIIDKTCNVLNGGYK